MKNQFLSFVMMLALVIVAGTTFAANETSVLPGGTYTYTLKNVSSVNAATAAVTYSDFTAEVTQVGTTWTIPGGTNSTVSFTIKYGTQALPAIDGDITVVITDITSGGCSNSIKLTIDVQPLPTYTLALAKDEAGYTECQARTGAGNNLTDARGTETNTFTFTVTPVVTGVAGNFDYSYKIILPTSSLTAFTISGPTVSAGVVTHTGVTTATLAPDVFTVTFKTTTGVVTESLLAELSVGIVSTMNPEDGEGTYEASLTSGGSLSQSVSVKAVPSIGTFN